MGRHSVQIGQAPILKGVTTTPFGKVSSLFTLHFLIELNLALLHKVLFKS